MCPKSPTLSVVAFSGLVWASILAGSPSVLAQDEEEGAETSATAGEKKELPDTAARRSLEEGLALQRKAKYDDALKELEKALGLAPTSAEEAEILVEVAETYFRKGKDVREGEIEPGTDPSMYFREARARFAKAVERHPAVEGQSDYASYMIGSCELMLGDMDRALDAYKKAYFDYRGSDQAKKAMIRLGVCLAGQGHAPAAIQVYESYIEHFGKDPELASTVKKLRQYIGELRMVGQPAPSLGSVQWLEGSIDKGFEELRGEVVVLVFFATWCKVCNKETEHLKREIAHWKGRGVNFVGVADPNDPQVREPVEFFVKRHEVDFFDVALDPGGRSWYPYRVSGLPAAVVIDQQGVVRWRGHFAFLGRTLLEKLTGQ